MAELATPPSRQVLRAILQRLTSSTLQALVLDYFPAVQQRLDQGTDKLASINLCFTLCSDEKIWAALQQAAPQFEEVQNSLRRQANTAVAASAINRPPLPAANSLFVGRDSALSDVHALLLRHRGVAITGLGGLGKSSLMLAYAHHFAEQHPGALVFWMLATSAGAVEQGWSELGQHLRSSGASPGMPPEQEPAVVRQWVQAWLAREQDWLLLWDNADDLDSLRPLVPDLKRGLLLCTTRARDPKALGLHPYHLQDLSPAAATALLAERSGRSTAQPEEGAAALTLATELGYLPLALEQAAAYIARHDTTFHSYLRKYQRKRLELFPTGSHGQERASVRTVWSLSLSEVEQECPAAADLLRTSAFYAPDFIPERLIIEGAKAGHLGPHLCQAIAAEDADLDEVFGPLLQHSLVRRLADRQGFSVHRLVQAFVRHRLGSESERLWAERAMQALHSALPAAEFASWPQCRELIPCAEAIDSHSARFGMVRAEVAQLLSRAAHYLYEQANYGRAEPFLRRALQIREQTLGPVHPDTAQSLNNLALLLLDQGKPAEAEPLMRKAVLLREQVLGPDHLDTALSLNNLASLLNAQSKPAEAEPLYRRALQIREQALGPDHPGTAQSLNNLATLLRDQGKLLDAEPLYRRALQIREQKLGPNHPSTAQSMNNLASLLYVQGKLADAEPLLSQALAILETALGTTHPTTELVRDNLARLRAIKEPPGPNQRTGPDSPSTDLPVAQNHLSRRGALVR